MYSSYHMKPWLEIQGLEWSRNEGKSLCRLCWEKWGMKNEKWYIDYGVFKNRTSYFNFEITTVLALVACTLKLKELQIRRRLQSTILRGPLTLHSVSPSGNVSQDWLGIKTWMLTLVPSTDFIQISLVLPALVYVCRLCSFNTCVDSCNHHFNQDTELFHDLQSHPFIVTPILLALPILS